MFSVLNQGALGLGESGPFPFELHEETHFFFVRTLEFVFQVIDFDFEAVLLFFEFLLEFETSMFSFRFEEIDFIEKLSFELLPVSNFFIKLGLKVASGLSFDSEGFPEVLGFVIVLLDHFIQFSGFYFDDFAGLNDFGFVGFFQSHFDLLLCGFVFGGIRDFALLQTGDFHLELGHNFIVLGLFVLDFVALILKFVSEKQSFLFVSGFDFDFPLGQLL